MEGRAAEERAESARLKDGGFPTSHSYYGNAATRTGGVRSLRVEDTVVKCDLDMIERDSPIKRDGEKRKVSKKSASNPEELCSAHADDGQTLQ
ncbi:hypothetical protein IRJ41_014116 [Triplophysa rosa]|uniref:Uncharacterized protein n=1 Tax=Triplophysa rosa TaxID=992332 RepID=A0A9W7T845_TRIRA|nr:hypothetical protein IRJ41_014116 [Triplophysa rosa]